MRAELIRYGRMGNRCLLHKNGFFELISLIWLRRGNFKNILVSTIDFWCGFIVLCGGYCAPIGSSLSERRVKRGVNIFFGKMIFIVVYFNYYALIA